LRRDRQQAVLLERGVDAMALEVGLELGEVLPAGGLQRLQLSREARGAVRQPMGQRGVDKAAVAPARAPARGLGLEDHDLALGLLALGQQRGPEAGETAADDRQVSVGSAVEGRSVGRTRAIEPERGGGHVVHRTAAYAARQ
jgi:hypothetical protein